MSDSLPVDIVLFVLEHLDFELNFSCGYTSEMDGYHGVPTFHLPTLHACSLVCRLWAELAQPLLFRHALLHTRKQVQFFLAAIAGNTERCTRLKESIRRITIHVTSGHWAVGTTSSTIPVTVERPSEYKKGVPTAGTTDDLVRMLRCCPRRGLHHLTVVADDLMDFSGDSSYVALDQNALNKLESPPPITCLSVKTRSDQPNIAPWQLLRMFAPSVRILALLGSGRIPDYEGPSLELQLYEFIWMKTRSLGSNCITPLLGTSRGYLKALTIRGPKVDVGTILDEHCQHLQSICVYVMGYRSGFPPSDWTRFTQLRQLIMDNIVGDEDDRRYQLDLPECMQHLGKFLSGFDIGENDSLREGELWSNLVRRLPNLRVVNVPPETRNFIEDEMMQRGIEIRTEHWVGGLLGSGNASTDRQFRFP
jgi:hypothetical protein